MIFGLCWIGLDRVMSSNHIAIFVKYLSVGGVQKIMVRLANEFADRGYKVDLVLAKGEGPLANDVNPDVRVVALESHRMWWALPNLMRYLRTETPDTLLAAGWQVNVIAAWAKLLSLTGFRLVLSVRTSITRQSRNSNVWFAPLNPWAVKVFYPVADAIHTLSEGVLADLSEVSNAAAQKGTVVYNPVFSQALLAKAREDVSNPWFSQKNDGPILLGVGRLGPQKNFALLIRAFARLEPRRNARLVMLGDGEERGELERITRELNVQERVDFMGFVDNPYKYMANASLLVMSSTFEGFGNVLVEALACGCPVVSTDCPSGPREILEDGKWGHLVPVGDEEALAKAMRTSLNEEHDPERLRQRAMHFSVDEAVDEYLDLLFPNA
jgi:glycosyltransferase involved in cell wall biosynthesis